MHIEWQDCQVFVSVAETGSFSAAARRLRLTQPTVSRRIAALEERLGRPLFRRDKEGAHLTSEGERLLPAAQQMGRWAAEMESTASGWEAVPQGVVRCAAPPGLAFELLVPLAVSLRKRFPGVRLDLITGIEHLDLTRGEVDLALRTRAPQQAELVRLASFHVEIGVFVAPRLRRRLPKGRVQAHTLPWVTWCQPMEHVPPRPQLERALDPFNIAFASNDYLVQRRAVDEGLGAFILPRTHHPLLPWRKLVELETDLPLPIHQTMHLVTARSMRHVPRVRAVAEHLTQAMAEIEGVRVEPG